MATRNENLTAFRAVHPGEILRAELKERGIKQKAFAAQIGMQPTHLNAFLSGSRRLSEKLALELETALGISAAEWLSMQANFDYDRQILSKRSAAEQAAIAELEAYDAVIAVRDFLKRLNVLAKDSVGRLAELKAALHNQTVAELSALGCGGLFRKSEKVGLDTRMTKTWILLAKCAAEKLSVTGTYERAETGKLVLELRKIFNENQNTLERLTAKFSAFGIKFGVEPKLEKASVDGVSFFSSGVPCIVVTKRFDQIDSFAFSVMHELGHVSKHLNEGGNDFISATSYSKVSTEEREADAFARDALIPNGVWNGAPKVKMNLNEIQREYTRFAKEIGCNKWIVLGRISHELSMYGFRSDASRKIS